MGQQSKKQIKAQLRNEITKEYKDRIYYAEQECVVARAKFFTEQKLRVQAEEKVALLQEEVDMYKDWVCRLQEFMDMDPDSRKEAVTQYRTSKELDRFSNILNMYEKMFEMF